MELKHIYVRYTKILKIGVKDILLIIYNILYIIKRTIKLKYYSILLNVKYLLGKNLLI